MSPVLGQRPAIRSGRVPALADGFTHRPESAPPLEALAPGTTIALVSATASPPGQPAGACGKTQLAAHYTQALWRARQVEFLAWIDASSRAAALAGYAQAATAIGVEVTGPAETAAARLTGWLASTAQPWLIVLDDVHDPADLDGLWPHGPAGRVLITTPDEKTVRGASSEHLPHVFPVGPFSSREALSYLMGRLAGDPDQRHGAIDLALILEGDPEALTHASATIATTTESCAGYQRRYTDTLARMTTQAHGQPPAAAAVTWRLSAERAGQLCPGGTIQLLLALTAMLDGQAIPASMFTTAAVCEYLAGAPAPPLSADQVRDALQALERTGLLTIDTTSTPPVVQVSRPIAALARAAIPSQITDRAAIAAADALLEIWPQPEPATWLAVQIRSCAAALQRTAADQLWAADACHPLLHTTGHSLDTARLTGPAMHHWAQLTTASDRILGPQNPHTLTTGTQLAHALLAAGQPSEATAWWQWLAASHTRISGPTHPATLAARLNLGRSMLATGQPSDAITVMATAVTDHERIHGPAHPDTLRARTQLAAACQASGRTSEAIEHYHHNLAHHEHTHGAHHPATMTARSHLAAAYLAGGQPTDAITCYQEVLAARQHVLGPGHIDTITTRSHLAAAHHAAGDIAAALQLHEQARADYERILGTDHPDTLAARADLADIYHAAGRLADAATLRRNTPPRNDPAGPPGYVHPDHA